MQFGQEMETPRILVAEKYIDIGLVDKTLGSLVSTSWKKYEKVFMNIRKAAPDPFLGEYCNGLQSSYNAEWKSSRANHSVK